MDIEPFFVPGVIVVMGLFGLVLGGVALYSRGGQAKR